MKAAWIILLLLSISGAMVLLVRTETSIEKHQFNGNTMGGTWLVKTIDIDRPGLDRELQGILDQLDSTFSTWRADSEVSRFNASRSTDWFPVSTQFLELVQIAVDVNRDTAGAFDITVAPLVNLWGFGPTGRIGSPPSDEQIAAARSHVGAGKLTLRAEPPALRKSDPLLQIDLSAIAKGYAADRLAAHLDRQGINNYLVTVGGENRAKGRSWRIGIETPTPDVLRIIETLDLRDAAISTSGDYRNFIEIAGRRLSHQIDSRTGRPVNHTLASVTVIDQSGARADALATGLFVLGAEEGFAKARNLNLPALFIERSEGRFALRPTPQFDQLKSPSQSTSRGAHSTSGF